MRVAQLKIHKEEFSFSAGHFTIFSATEREKLHGHNYALSVSFQHRIEHNGFSFDYRHYKKKLRRLCKKLDGHMLLPAESPYLKLSLEDEYQVATFNNQRMLFLKDDVVVLPLTNITIEELAYWFLQQLVIDQTELNKHGIFKIIIDVYNGPGQSGGATWEKMH